MKPVLFVGDINVDIIMGGLESLPVADREITCTSFDVLMGSSAVLAACAFTALGGGSRFLGLAGRDDYGTFMLDGLRKLGVDTSLVRLTEEVRTGVTINLIHGRQRSQVTYPGTIAAFDGGTIGADVFEGVRHVHFAGPYLQTRLRPHITRLLGVARQRGVTTSLDTQWDPSEVWAPIHEWLPLLDILFVNADEAVSITGKSSAEPACTALAADTACPVVKDGRAGAVVAYQDAARRIPTYEAVVEDTTGAGDTFDAAFLYARLNRNRDIVEAARYANAAAARSCTFRGGIQARSSHEDVLAFMERKLEHV